MKISNDLFEEIVRRVCNGETLTSICREHGMPSRKTFVEMLKKDKERDARFEAAKQQMADVYFEEIVDIADGKNDVPISTLERDLLGFDNKDIHAVTRQDYLTSVGVREMRIRARIHAASKLAPRKYGPTQQMVISGDPDKPVTTVTRIEIVAPAILAAPKQLPDIEHEELAEFQLVNSED